MESRETLSCMGSFIKISKAMFFFKEELVQAMDRGVHVRILTEKNEHEKLIPNILVKYIFTSEPLLEVRYALNPLSTHILLVDEKQVIINTNVRSKLAESPAIYSHNPCMVALARNHFDATWPKPDPKNLLHRVWSKPYITKDS